MGTSGGITVSQFVYLVNGVALLLMVLGVWIFAKVLTGTMGERWLQKFNKWRRR